MTDSNTQEMAIEALVILSAALTNIRLYPTTSDMIGNSIDNAYSVLQAIIEKEDSVVFAESEGNLLISGEILSETNKKKPQVNSFLKLMTTLMIKSMSFEKGLDKPEILAFLEVLNNKPEDLEKEGGINKFMAAKGIEHILLDKKQFVAMDKNQRIVNAKEGEDKAPVQSDENTKADVESVPPSDDDRRTGNDRRANDSLEYLVKGGDERRKEEQRNKQLLRIQNGINSLLKGDDKAFMDLEVMRALPSTFLQMLSQRKDNVVEAIIAALGKGILSKNKNIRATGSIVLANISIKLITDQRIDDMLRISPRLIEWIKFETIVSPAYRHICNQLQSVAQSLILNYQIADGNQILEPFYLIFSGKIKKEDDIKNISGDVLKNLASNEVLHLLLDEFQTDKRNLGEPAADALVMLGSNSAGSLLDILNKLPESELPGTLKEKIQLQEKICTALGRIGSKEAVPILKSIIDRKEPLNTDILNKGVQAAARNALEVITKGPGKEGVEEFPQKAATKPQAEKEKTAPGEIKSADDELTRQLKLVDQYVEKKEDESAVKLLFDMIVKYAGEKDFTNADAVRDKLLDVAPMALTEIVESGEVIEKAKSEAIDQDRLNTWSELYDKLSDTETNALFFAMKSISYDENVTVFQQNESNSRLYFIYKGQIKLVSDQDGEEIHIKDLGTGDVMGEDTFFSLTVCTASAITVSGVELDFLEKDALTKLEKENSGIGSKLSDYCLKLEKVSDLLKKQGRSRRSYERVNTSGKVSMQAIDTAGSHIGETVMGTLSDVSMGGLSFYLKIPKDKADNMFLEPNVKIKCILKAGDSQHKIDQRGKVVGVLSHMYDHSVHIKFDKQLDEKLFHKIKESADSKDDELDILTDP